MKYDNGGSLQPGMSYLANDTSKPEWRITYEQWQKINKVLRPKKPIKLWHIKDYGRITWFWSCRLCPTNGLKETWDQAYKSADHHARNKHNGGRPR